MKVFFIFLVIALALSATQSGHQAPDSDTHSGKPDNVASSLSDLHRLPGCGAGKGGADVYDQTTCGNYTGAPYEDLGDDYFDKLHPERTAKRLVRRLERLGLTVSVAPTDLNPRFQDS